MMLFETSVFLFLLAFLNPIFCNSSASSIRCGLSRSSNSYLNVPSGMCTMSWLHSDNNVGAVCGDAHGDVGVCLC